MRNSPYGPLIVRSGVKPRPGRVRWGWQLSRRVRSRKCSGGGRRLGHRRRIRHNQRLNTRVSTSPRLKVCGDLVAGGSLSKRDGGNAEEENPADAERESLPN